MDERKERKIKEYLDSYGISHNTNGYCFLVEVIKGMMKNGSTVKLQWLYDEVGKQCGITGACVSSTIRYSVKHSDKASGIKIRTFIKDGVDYAKTGYLGK